MTAQSRRSPRVLIAAVVLVAAVIFGGGGYPAPTSELVVELVALGGLGIWLLLKPHGPANPIDTRLWAGVAIFVAIPLIQLVPLPPALWQALPGRETETAALTLIGLEGSWRPLSIDPYRTLAAVLSLIPPVTMIFMVARLSLSERTSLLGVAGIMGGVAAAVGLVQRASGHSNLLRFYEVTSYGFATGFQANRNAEADILIVAMLAAAAFLKLRMEPPRSWLARAILAAGAGLLVLSVVLTGSRAGSALLLVAAVGVAFIARPRFQDTKRLIVFALVGIVALAVAVPVLSSIPALQQTWQRYDNHLDPRAQLWKDTLFTAKSRLATGVGVGNFVPVFEAQEPLESVDPSAPNRAHNDYLEWTLETGLIGLVILIALISLLAWRAATIIRTTASTRYRTQAAFAVAAMAVLGLHSIVDYPMRSISLAVFCALAIGMLALAPPAREKLARHGSGPTPVDGGDQARGMG